VLYGRAGWEAGIRTRYHGPEALAIDRQNPHSFPLGVHGLRDHVIEPIVRLDARNGTKLAAVSGRRTEYRDELLPAFLRSVSTLRCWNDLRPKKRLVETRRCGESPLLRDDVHDPDVPDVVTPCEVEISAVRRQRGREPAPPPPEIGQGLFTARFQRE
jgi:hypothetical protein